MKPIILLFLSLPSLSFAQKLELGVSGGKIVYCPSSSYLEQTKPRYTTAAGLLMNINHWQIGANYETGSNFMGGAFYLPQISMNWRFDFPHFYWYVGNSIGFLRYVNIYENNLVDNGIVRDIHTGIVYKVGKHLGFNAEVSATQADMRYHFWGNEESPPLDSRQYIPICIGARYRF